MSSRSTAEFVMISAGSVAAAGVCLGAELHPVGLTAADVVVSAALGVLVVVTGVQAGGTAVLLAWAAVVAFVSGGVAITAAGIGVVAAVAAVLAARRSTVGAQAALAVSSVALVVGLTGLRDLWFSRSSSAAAAVAVLVVVITGWWSLAAPWRRRAAWITAGFAAVLLLAAGFAGVAVLQARGSMADAKRDLREAFRLVRDGDTVGGRDMLRRAHREVIDAQGWLDGPWQQPARVLPVVGQNLRAASDVLIAVERAADLLDATAESASLQGLGLVDGAVDLEATAKIAADVEVAAGAIQHVHSTVTDQRSPWLVGPLRSELTGVLTTIAGVESDLVHARDVLAVLPTMLGGEGERRYLVMFVTPSESRGSGGFPGQSAELSVRDGRVTLGRQTRSSDLIAPDGENWTLRGVDEYVRRYGAFRVQSDWRNITMSPDFPTVATVARQLYEQATGTHLDGVLRVGPRAFTALIELSGPIVVDGLDEPLTADNAYAFFTRGQYDGRFPDIDARVDVLTRIVEAVIRQVTTKDFADPRDIGDVMGPVIAAGDLAVWTSLPAEEAAIEPLGLSGAVPPADVGDSLFLTQHDLLTNKIDAWSSRHIDYRLDLDRPAGTVSGTLAVTLANTAPTDAPVGQVGNEVGLPSGTMRELLTIYSPHVLDDFRVDGEPVNVLLQSELGRFAYVVEVEVAAGRSVEITAVVNGTLSLVDGAYRLTMPVVPGVNPDTATVAIDGVVTEHTFTGRLVLTAR